MHVTIHTYPHQISFHDLIATMELDPPVLGQHDEVWG
jgi:hypothetical protein